MKKVSISLISLSIILATTFCRKEEPLKPFNSIAQNTTQDTALPPASLNDSTVNATAKLNGGDFNGLGRCVFSKGKINMYIFNLKDEFTAIGVAPEEGESATSPTYNYQHQQPFLQIALNRDQTGEYKTGYRISSPYTSFGSNTSSGTRRSGGSVIVTDIVKQEHKIKGTFALSFYPKSGGSDSAIFNDGAFDMVYNHLEMDLDGSYKEADGDEINKTIKSALKGGSKEAPKPKIAVLFTDSLTSDTMRLQIGIIKTFKKLGQYPVSDKEDFVLTDIKSGKIYYAISGKLNLTKFNYIEFLQATFECELQTDTGEKKNITKGSVALGSIYNTL